MKFKTILVLLILCCLIYTISADEAYSQEEEWGVFSSRFCTVFFEEGINLNTVSRRINLRFSDFYNPRRYRGKADLSTEEILAEKFDSIFSKVEDILDMYPSRVQVTINIYKTKGGLDEAYEDIFDEPTKQVLFTSTRQIPYTPRKGL